MVEKRNRPPVSCEPCRARKSKCNRALPCDTCIKRNHASSCQYAANVRRTEGGVSKRSSVADRLRNLEALVSTFVAQELVVQPRKQTESESVLRNLANPSAELGLPPGTNRNGSRLSTREKGLDQETPRPRQTFDGQVNYVDSSHWLAILEDIRETLDLDEILASLPPQAVCDKLLSHYFNSRHLVIGVVHPFEFQKEVPKAPVLWVALLFALLSVAGNLLRLARAHEPDDGSIPAAGVLQQRAAECLVLGRFATANAHALEAFILHIQSRLLSRMHSDSFVDLWFEMGTAIRLAFRMGHHRDPRNMPAVSPFDGEMRRRVWANIFQVDALISFQMGFPSMIPTEYCDAQPPRNLEYSDFGPEMAALPPSRPLTDDIPVLYIIAKAGIMSTFKKIVAHSQSLAPPAYDSTIALDLEARDVYARLPEPLRRRDVGRCGFLDPASRILERCTLELLHLKSLVILHRRYVGYGHEQPPGGIPRFETSRRACAEAALEILTRQANLHRASQPGGRLFEDRWMLGSLMVHDFLLAAMVLCLNLSVCLSCSDCATAAEFGAEGPAAGGGDGAGGSHHDLADKELYALQQSLQIWSATSPLSPEAHTASLAL
ncbi:hypothetical protein VTI74DRAFT_666 [Chaetomium olivicolor]